MDRAMLCLARATTTRIILMLGYGQGTPGLAQSRRES